MRKIKTTRATINQMIAYIIVSSLWLIVSYIIINSANGNAPGNDSAPIQSIPVILNYDGTVWIDQKGEPMQEKVVKNFLANNSKFAWEILYLNKNRYYATKLQNYARSEVLDQLWEQYIARRVGEEHQARDDEACRAILNELIADPPTDVAYAKIINHLGCNGLVEDVKDLQKACQADRNVEITKEQIPRLVFCWAMTKNYDSGYLEKACGRAITPLS